MDLLTVVMHELGHVLGRDSRFGGDPSDLMAAYLGTGDRRPPLPGDVTAAGDAWFAGLWDGGPRRRPSALLAGWLAVADLAAV